MNLDILDYKLKGYCCSQIIMEMGLVRLGKENPDLVKASAGLCDGLYQGYVCGILSAATCLLYLADPEEASRSLAADLNDWFTDAFGSTECSELLGDDPLNKVEKCPMMLEATFKQVEELLEWDQQDE